VTVETSELFDRVYSITEAMIVDDLKTHVRDTMVEWGWAIDHGDSYELTTLGRKQLDDSPKREVLVHFNVSVDVGLSDEHAKKQAVDDIWFAAKSGERPLFENMIALVDPT
jgi:hypothetical protein